MLTSCATVVSGSSQKVSVQAIDSQTHKIIPSAKCTITNSKNVAYALDNNPDSVELPKEYGNLNVNCIAKGYRQDKVSAGQSFNAWAVGNILFWPGAIVDAATGAAAKYPSHITVLMAKN